VPCKSKSEKYGRLTVSVLYYRLPAQTLEQTCMSVLKLRDRRDLLNLSRGDLQVLCQFLKGVKVTVRTDRRGREKSIRDFIPDVGQKKFDKGNQTTTVKVSLLTVIMKCRILIIS
jgi:hypothetical protein